MLVAFLRSLEMDYRQLTPAELVAIGRTHNLLVNGNLPPDWPTRMDALVQTPGATVAVELADLYLATLLAPGLQVDPGQDFSTLDEDQYLQLAPTLYLPSEYNSLNVERLQRIVRILRGFTAAQELALQPVQPLTQPVQRPVQPLMQPVQRPVQPLMQPVQRPVQPVQQPTQPILRPVQPTQYSVQQEAAPITILPLQYKGPGQNGDFAWMITQPQYDDVLFLFNDNEEQFRAALNYFYHGGPRATACVAGGGNAVIRPYQCLNPPRAAGLPTGAGQRGYQDLNTAQPVIDAAFTHINNLLATGRYQRIAYSAGPDGRSLGTAIFAPQPAVTKYIVDQIYNLV